MTSAFRKDSKTFGVEPEESNLQVSTSVPDLTVESSQASEPIEGFVDPPPEVPQPIEPPNGMPPSVPSMVEPTEPQLPEPAVTLEEPTAEIAYGLQVPEPAMAEALSESPQIMPVEERVGMDLEDLDLTSRPDVQFENHIPSRPPSSYNSEHPQDDSDSLAPAAVLE
ncbi:hypothetical protein BS47DRAFT_609266 [Hydnum rufescens UP504]|uniref:Uncharacterized protein n=1 Tax=Hydnum rufescens UP504 TaxID=1448309 RepID=A0A9P6B3R4_9AGAM|nr:hypothetical protein BS47DRAFT_609266 [Hydnum rufescens UP504]